MKKLVLSLTLFLLFFLFSCSTPYVYHYCRDGSICRTRDTNIKDKKGYPKEFCFDGLHKNEVRYTKGHKPCEFGVNDSDLVGKIRFKSGPNWPALKVLK